MTANTEREQLRIDELADELLQREQELERLRSWDGLIELLNAHWPATVFSGKSGDPGPVIVALIRVIDTLKEDYRKIKAIREFVDGEDVHWWHGAYSELRDAILEAHSTAFEDYELDGEEAEGWILCRAAERLGTAARKGIVWADIALAWDDDVLVIVRCDDCGERYCGCYDGERGMFLPISNVEVQCRCFREALSQLGDLLTKGAQGQAVDAVFAPMEDFSRRQIEQLNRPLGELLRGK